MPSIFIFLFSFENNIFTLSPLSSSNNYKIVIIINTLTTMNNQFEVLNAPKIDLPFFFLHSYELNTTSLSLSLHIKLKKSKILILHFLWFIESKKLTILGGSLSFEILCSWRSLMCAKEICSSKRLTWKLSGQRIGYFCNRLSNLFSETTENHKQNYYRSFLYKDKLGVHLIWKKTLSEDFQKVQTTLRKSRRLKWKLSGKLPESRLLPNEEKSDIRTYQNAQIYYERENSSKDFHEVQTTSMKSRRLP
ncbi:hypothetical protein IGI04_034996 [Brassica rapa subsp. trilocularis]|uniref:Uncharacterized protein n=1 Tax=Brassica rapa subsp. trilocularis TaxID=1813537 RepID=A0ABQ7LE78_BRACM|nr:hypothetical protein IGI04_034996 [Brassica rapa subsp. trilocularis]